MKPRIGILTSGGDCPGLNAVLRAVVLAADKLGWEVVGFRDGFEGLLPPGNHVILDRQAVNGIMALGGTILGTTNRGHFVAKVGAGDRTIVPAKNHCRRQEDPGGPRRASVDHRWRRRLAGDCATVAGIWHQLHRRTEDDRQRSRSDGDYIRFRFCR